MLKEMRLYIVMRNDMYGNTVHATFTNRDKANKVVDWLEKQYVMHNKQNPDDNTSFFLNYSKLNVVNMNTRFCDTCGLEVYAETYRDCAEIRMKEMTAKKHAQELRKMWHLYHMYKDKVDFGFILCYHCDSKVKIKDVDKKHCESSPDGYHEE